MEQIIKVAWDLNEKTENRYQLVYEIAELAKKLVDENQAKKAREAEALKSMATTNTKRSGSKMSDKEREEKLEEARQKKIQQQINIINRIKIIIAYPLEIR